MAENDIKLLNSLIATTIDSANGFEESAMRTRATSLASQLAEFARDRWAVVSTLQSEVGRMGGTPRQAGTAKAAVHRGWLELKNGIASSDRAVLQEVENGEAYLRTKYETALESGELSEAARRTISEAFDSVRRGHDRAQTLNHSFSAGLPEGRELNWRAIGTGIGIAAAIGSAAYAASRLAGSRRRGEYRARRDGMQPTETSMASTTVDSDRLATGASPSTVSSASVPSVAASSSRSRLDDSATRMTPAPRTTRRSTGASDDRLAASGMGDEADRMAPNAAGTSLGSEGSTPLGSFGATGNSDDLGKR